MYTLRLASQSPRRQQILSDLGYAFETLPTFFDERAVPESLSQSEYVAQVAVGKFQSSVSAAPVADTVVLAADLTVWANGKLVHKPETIEEAAAVLPTLWDQWHIEYGCCVVGTHPDTYRMMPSVSKVWLPALDSAQLAQYLEISDPTDKAGGIDIRCWGQIAGVEKIQCVGSLTNVIGLDAFAAAELLTEYQLPPTVPADEVERKYQQNLFGV